MKYLLLIGSLTLLFFSAHSQTNKWFNREIKHDSDLLHSTTWIVALNSGGTKPKVGTGYYFIYKNELYIITNSHIIDTLGKLSFDLEWMDHNRYFTIDDIQITIDDIQKRTLKFKGNKREDDLVAIKISGISSLNLNKYPKWRAFTQKNLPTKSDLDKLTFFDEQIISPACTPDISLPFTTFPIIFNGTFASDYNKNYVGEKLFLLNTDLNHGNSGAPVIDVKTKGRYLLLGTNVSVYENPLTIDSVNFKITSPKFIITMNKPEKIEDISFAEKFPNYRIWSSAHISVIIKSEKILELFNK
jgi:uncharacterized protein YacL (UPF0231 family)